MQWSWSLWCRCSWTPCAVSSWEAYCRTEDCTAWNVLDSAIPRQSVPFAPFQVGILFPSSFILLVFVCCLQAPSPASFYFYLILFSLSALPPIFLNINKFSSVTRVSIPNGMSFLRNKMGLIVSYLVSFAFIFQACILFVCWTLLLQFSTPRPCTFFLHPSHVPSVLCSVSCELRTLQFVPRS